MKLQTSIVSGLSKGSLDSAMESSNQSVRKEIRITERTFTAGFNQSGLEIKNMNEIENNLKNYNYDYDSNEEEMRIQQTNFSKNEIKDKISEIFLNFAKYYPEEKQFLLSQQSLIKIIKSLNLIEETNTNVNSLKLYEIDIIFRKINPHSNKINEKGFLNFIVQLVFRLFPKEYNENPKKCIDLFLIQTLEPYSKHINDTYKHTNSHQKLNNKYMYRAMDVLTRQKFDTRLSGLVNSIYFAIKEIYINYFNYEINKYKDVKKISEESLSSFINFCKDFEILPYVANIHQAVNYFNIMVKMDITNIFTLESQRELGECYTLSKFCLLFIHFSMLSYNKNNQHLNVNKNVTDVDKLLLFLEKLENSSGFLNFERRSNKPHTNKLTLIPSISILKMVDSNILKGYVDCSGDNFFNDGNSPGKKSNKLIKEFNHKSKLGEDYDLRKLMTVNNEVFGIINSKMNLIREVYLFYTQIGDKLHINRMNFSSYLRFLKDCDAITKLKKSFYANNNSSNTERNVSKMTSQFSSNLNSNSDSKLNTPRLKTTIKFSIQNSNSNQHNSNNSAKLNNNSKTPVYMQTITKLVNSDTTYGKLSETDANIIFYNLTGPKNFDNSSKIKNQFDRNFGYNPDTTPESSMNINNININNVNVIHKMDFFLFIKSFELLAVKLFPDYKLNAAVIHFIENVNIFCNKTYRN